ncbi:MAG: RNA polymerase subunit sigma-70, partial [Actinomycetota bacterium]|nr:RNA polymerase subunit sigma-70 [Actinomycetota bacterium]
MPLAGSYDARRGDARGWLLGIAANCLTAQHRSGYRRQDLLERLASVPEFRGDEHERVEAMLDATRAAPAVERALA